jgi:hypothetical protein
MRGIERGGMKLEARTKHQDGKETTPEEYTQ